MNSQQLKQEYMDLYSFMAGSNDPANMKAFGNVMTEMFMWMADNKPEAAQEWMDKLSAIKWHNYLTPKEAEMIVQGMDPQRPWSREQWRQVMEQHGFKLEEEPYYNHCALYVTMSMIYSDSSDTLKKYAQGADQFEVIHALALDKLKDKDEIFNIRSYFGL